MGATTKDTKKIETKTETVNNHNNQTTSEREAE